MKKPKSYKKELWKIAAIHECEICKRKPSEKYVDDIITTWIMSMTEHMTPTEWMYMLEYWSARVQGV